MRKSIKTKKNILLDIIAKYDEITLVDAVVILYGKRVQSNNEKHKVTRLISAIRQYDSRFQSIYIENGTLKKR